MSTKKYQLDDKLQFFHELLIQMVNRVEESIYQAMHAFKNHDEALAEKVVSEDYFIDQMRDLIESDGVRLLISEAPYGHYMRQVIAGLKIVTSLERMGDHAAHLAKLAVQTTEGSAHRKIVDAIADMALADAKMTRAAVDALIANDADMARQVAAMDDDIDERRKQINAMLFEEEPKDAKQRENLYNYFYIAKEMERLGDHVTTICSWIVYMAAGVKPDLN